MARLHKLTSRERQLIQEQSKPAKELYWPPQDLYYRPGANQHLQYKSKGISPIKYEPQGTAFWRGRPNGK